MDELLALREALAEARESVAEWGAYASPYFQEKWDFAGDLAKIDKTLADTAPAAQAIKERIEREAVKPWREFFDVWDNEVGWHEPQEGQPLSCIRIEDADRLSDMAERLRLLAGTVKEP